MGIIKENTLRLCDFCGGTGVDSRNKYNVCPNCKGLKVLNHFKIEVEFNIPYRNEETRDADAIGIETEISDAISKRMPYRAGVSMIPPERRRH